MKRQAPPLEAVEAFIVATRVASFRAAADQLALSPSALSRRIQALEAFLGVSLFDREGSTVALTLHGRRYLADVEPAIDAIRRATVDLKTERGHAPLRVVTPQSFAIGWLIPRISDFVEQSGGAQLEIKIGHDVDDLRRGLADIAILVGPLSIGGMRHDPIVELEAVVAAAPVLLKGRMPPTSLDKLHDYPRLATYRPSWLWETWLENVQYRGPELPPATRFEAQFLAFEAGAAGLGLVLAPIVLAHRFFTEGRLKPCFDLQAPVGVNYSLVYADSAIRRRNDTRRFASWLYDEVNRSQTEGFAFLHG